MIEWKTKIIKNWVYGDGLAIIYIREDFLNMAEPSKGRVEKKNYDSTNSYRSLSRLMHMHLLQTYSYEDHAIGPVND